MSALALTCCAMTHRWRSGTVFSLSASLAKFAQLLPPETVNHLIGSGSTLTPGRLAIEKAVFSSKFYKLATTSPSGLGSFSEQAER
jgi:hypothetical protein